MNGASVISLLLLVVSGFLLDAHRREWRRADAAAGEDPSERRFAARRRRRRTFASGAIGLAGFLFGTWPLAPQRPAWMAAYGAALALLAGLLMLMGLADAIATGRHGRAAQRRLREAQRAELLSLSRETNAPAEAGSAER